VAQNATDVILASVVDPLHPKTLCSITGGYAPRFVNATTIAYVRYEGSGGSASGSIIKLDLTSGKSTVVAGWKNGSFGSGYFAFSPDARLLVYLVGLPPDSTYTGAGGVQVHLVSSGQDRVIATLPGVPGRGVSPDDDDVMLSFSPAANYFALVETFTVPASLDRSPFQVRRSDGTLVATVPKSMAPFQVVPAAAPGPAPGAGTMGVWSGTGAHLYFRTDAGVNRLDPGSDPSLLVPGIKWIRPHASADGKWISYTVRDSNWLPHTGLYDVTGSTGARLVSELPRDSAVFLTSTKLWYEEVRACVASDSCGMGPPAIATGKAFIYDLVTRQETPSTIGSVVDVWPRSTN
jgi:hypothetical protein